MEQNKPRPKVWIPANAQVRNPAYWNNPDSLCRTCVYLCMQEPFCKTVDREGRAGTVRCSGYERERLNA